MHMPGEDPDDVVVSPNECFQLLVIHEPEVIHDVVADREGRVMQG